MNSQLLSTLLLHSMTKTWKSVVEYKTQLKNGKECRDLRLLNPPMFYMVISLIHFKNERAKQHRLNLDEFLLENNCKLHLFELQWNDSLGLMLAVVVIGFVFSPQYSTYMYRVQPVGSKKNSICWELCKINIYYTSDSIKMRPNPIVFHSRQAITH